MDTANGWDHPRTSSARVDWTPEELILALDLYMSEGGLRRSHPKVIELSELIARLPLHQPEEGNAGGRTPSAVARKLGNLSNFDPSYEGQPTRGSKLDRRVWEQWADRPGQLRAEAAAIRSRLQVDRSDDA